MADNTILDPGTGGDTIRDKDRAGVKTPIVAIDLNPAGSETLMAGSMPVTAASLPLPAGAATSAKQPALGTAGAASTDVLSVQGIASMTALKTDGSAVTQPISAASLPLPSGASTAAKQPALGTAGSASADVLSVQGVASMTALKVDGSGVTQPVSLAGTQSVNQAQVAGTTVDTNSGVKSAGTQRVVLATDQPQLTNALKVDGSAVTQPVSGTVTANAGTGPFPVSDNAGSLTVDAPVGTPVFVTVTPSTTGGWTPKVFSAASAAAKTLINGAACAFGGHLTIYNPNVSVAYIQVFDAASTAAVTVGTTPATALIIIPATSAANVEVTNGVHMASGIVIAATTTAGGSTGVTTALDGTILYK